MANYCWTWGLSLRVVCFPSKVLLEKTKFFICKWLPTKANVCVKARGMCPHLPPLGPYLVQTWADPVRAASVSGFTCTQALLCLEGLDFLVSLSPAGSSLLLPPLPQFPEPRLSVPRSLTLCIVGQWLLCLCSHLLQEEASLMMAEQGAHP